jgi:ribosomal protein S18 acetylase RimI-like enzyme
MIELRHMGPSDADLARVAVQRFKGRVHDIGEWLQSDRHMMIVALEGRTTVGWVYGYELPRLDRDERMWLLYEIDVAESYRKRGIGGGLLDAFRRLADGPVWLVSNASNKAAMALYAGGERPNDDDVMLRFPQPKARRG